MMTVLQAAFRMNVCPETVRRWIRSGRLQAERISDSGEFLIPEESLKEFCKNNPKYKRLFGKPPLEQPPEICETAADASLLLDKKNAVEICALNCRIAELEKALDGFKAASGFIQKEITDIKRRVNILLSITENKQPPR